MLIKILIANVTLVFMLLFFGAFYTLIRSASCSNIQKTFGSKGFILFSFIGTPIHELSHYLACKIFHHKIEEVVLFSPKKWKKTGELGHVNHSYNPKKIYQRAGNFIIGLAPVITGALLSYFLFHFVFDLRFVSEALSLADIPEILKTVFIEVFKIFNIENMTNSFFWIVLFVIINIFLHTSLSKADFKNSFAGCIFFLALIPLIAFGLDSFGIISLDIFYLKFINLIFTILFIFILGLMFSALVYGFSFICFGIKKTYYRKCKNIIIK